MTKPLPSIIFYADDDVDDLDFFKEVTNQLGTEVFLFEEGDKMLDSLFNPPPKPSVIFLDLNMPIRSGFEILKEIKKKAELRDIPIVIFTTSVNPEDIAQAKDLGANLYVRKPTTIDALKKAVSFVLTTDWPNFRPSDKEFFYRPG